MREFIRKNQRLLLCSAISLSVGLLAGLFIPRAQEPAAPEAGERAAAVDRIGLASVLPDTVLRMEYRFTGCGHTLSRIVDNSRHIGQTGPELVEDYPGSTVLRFSAEQVELQCTCTGACPQHVTLKADESGQLHILQTDPETMETASLQTLTVYASAFDPETAEELYEGISFDSVTEIDQYLENAES